MNLIIILLFFQEGKSFMGDSSSSHYYCTDMWRNLIGSASGRGCRFVFGLHPIYIYIYIYMPQFFLPPHFIVDPEREFVTSRTLLPSSFHTLHPFIETIPSPRDHLLGKSSLLFFYQFFIL